MPNICLNTVVINWPLNSLKKIKELVEKSESEWWGLFEYVKPTPKIFCDMEEVWMKLLAEAEATLTKTTELPWYTEIEKLRAEAKAQFWCDHITSWRAANWWSKWDLCKEDVLNIGYWESWALVINFESAWSPHMYAWWDVCIAFNCEVFLGYSEDWFAVYK